MKLILILIKIRNSLIARKGFSLVEVMIVTGMLAGLSLFVVRMMKQSSKVSTKLDYRTDLSLVTNEINSILSNPVSCLNTFVTDPTIPASAADNLTPIDIQKQKIPATNPDTFSSKFPVGLTGSGFGASHLKIASYTLSYVAATREGELLIKYKNSRILKGNSSRDLISRKIKLYIESTTSVATGAKVITMCKSIASQENSIWTRAASAATSNANIYYSKDSPGAPSLAGLTDPLTGDPLDVMVGIGTSTPTHMLEVNGLVQAVGHVYSSDRRLKKNIKKIPNVVQRTMKLQGVQFMWKNTKSAFLKNKKQIGFIAQDVEKSFPEVVLTSKKTGLKSVGYANLIAPLIEVIKVHQKEIQAIKKRLHKLEIERN